MDPVVTREGTILGTAAYMAAEQACGQPIDRRADVWAFGAVLYEMLTGRRAFPGETLRQTLGAVLNADPDWSALPTDTPVRIRRLLALCLDRDVRHRVRDMATVGSIMDGAFETATAPQIPEPLTRGPSWSRGWWRWTAGSVFAVLAIVVAWSARPVERPNVGELKEKAR